MLHGACLECAEGFSMTVISPYYSVILTAGKNLNAITARYSVLDKQPRKMIYHVS